MTSALIKHLEFEFKQLQIEFEKASHQGSGTPQEIADFREGYFKRFIQRYFPLPHKVTKGQIVDSIGNKSNSIDCLVLNPCHPNTVTDDGKFSVIFADGVDVAIELKPDLSKKDELERGLIQIQSVKKLKRVNTPLLLANKKPSEIVELSKRIPSFIFSLQGKKNLEDTARDMCNFYSKNHIPQIEQVDFIVSLTQGMIYNCKHESLCYSKAKKVGVYMEGWEELTLAAFLLRASTMFPSVANMSEPLVHLYLSQIVPKTYKILSA